MSRGHSPNSFRNRKLRNRDWNREFSLLVTFVQDILQSKRTEKLQSCIDYCVREKLLKDEEVHQCTQFRKLFTYLSKKRMEWRKHSILADIIELCDSQEAKQEYDKWKKKMALSYAWWVHIYDEDKELPGYGKVVKTVTKSYRHLTDDDYESSRDFILIHFRDIVRHVSDPFIPMLLK